MKLGNCAECGRELAPGAGRLVVVYPDGSERVWCLPCVSGASYAGHVWGNVQAAAWTARLGAKGARG